MCVLQNTMAENLVIYEKKHLKHIYDKVKFNQML